jgi:hypothetical protein
MELQQLIEKWTKEMADIKSHIKKHEDTFGHPAVTSKERLEAISDMLADIKQLKISSNPLLDDSSFCQNCHVFHNNKDWEGYCCKSCWDGIEAK